MTVIIRNGKIVEEHFEGRFADASAGDAVPYENAFSPIGIDVPSSIDPEQLIGLASGVAAVRIEFPSFADGRGFSLAAQLRRAGFDGLLRARGHLISDQYPMAVRSGFDEVEISNALLARQPVELWAEALRRVESTYFERLCARRPVRKAA
jgi:uncharacterized protein (DUF934 family)